MEWIKEEVIDAFLSKKDYDIKKSHNSRWIDFNCTPDIISIVSDGILNFTLINGKDAEFTAKNIWQSKYVEDNIQIIFKNTEFFSFFQQSMKLLSYSGVLSERKIGRETYFKIENINLLSYLSADVKNAVIFLNLYIIKVLKDCGIYEVFLKFFADQNVYTYKAMKNAFYLFTVKYTKIGNKTGDGYQECGRIFIKVLNPLAYNFNSLGSERGLISKEIIKYYELMFFEDNFRDVYLEKPKNMTKKEYEFLIKLMPNSAYDNYIANKSKNFIKKYNDLYRSGYSEVVEIEELYNEASDIHHIFSKNDFPNIASYYENLIALTPNQHNHKAHPENKINIIDKNYQYFCLINKADRIKENIEDNKTQNIYDFKKFLYVIRVGLDDESYLNINDGDYTLLKSKLAKSYVNILVKK